MKGFSATFDNVTMSSDNMRTVTLDTSKTTSDGWGGAFYAVCGDGACKTSIKNSVRLCPRHPVLSSPTPCF